MSKKKRAKEIVGYSVKAMFKRTAVDGACSNLVGWSKQNRKELLERVPYHERLVGDFLTERKIVFVPQCPFFFKELNKMCFVDYYVPGGNYIIEVDGGYHNMAIQTENDTLRDLCFEKKGMIVIRIKNSETEGETLAKKLLPVTVYAKSAMALEKEKKVEADAEKEERRKARKARKAEEKMNGEGKWKPMVSILTILESAQEGSEVLFITDKKSVATGAIYAFQGKAGIFGISGDIAITIRQRRLSAYIWWNDSKLPGFLKRHPSSPIAKERRRISKAYPVIEDYFENAFRV